MRSLLKLAPTLLLFANPYIIANFCAVQEEIEERREFLADMVAGGKGGEYGPIITAQISKLVREMEVIDQSRNAELQRQINLQEQSS